LLGLDNDPMI